MSLDVVRARVSFRERAFLDVLDLALRFVSVHVRLYARVAVVVLLPAIAIAYGAASAWGWIGGWTVAVGLGFLVQVPFTVLASRVVFQETVRAREVLRAALGDMPRIVAMRIVWLLAIAFSFLIMFLPAAWVALALGFTNEAMLLERASLFSAFKRSTRISMSSFFQSLLIAVVTACFPVLAAFLADVGGRQLIGELFQFAPPAAATAEGGSVLALIGWFAVVPYLATARFFVYLNVRTRAEGWDVQTRFAAIAARAEAA